MYTDVIQGMTMLFCAIIGVIVGFSLVGGLSGLTNSLMNIDPSIFSPGGRGYQFEGQYGEIIGALLLYMIGYMGLPHITAFEMAARDTKVIEDSALINPIWASLLTYSCVFIGLFGIILLPNLSDPELTAPTFFYKYMNPWIAGLMMAGVYCAIMSTADSLTLNSASLLVNDVYVNYFKPDIEDKKRLLYTRMATLCMGFLALMIALIPGMSVFTVVVSAFGTLASAFVFPNLAAVYWKRATPAGVLCSMIGGAATNATWEVLGLRALTHIHPFFIGLIVSGLLLLSVSLLTQPMPQEKQNLVDISRGLEVSK
jgi:sodium/proline symporter